MSLLISVLRSGFVCLISAAIAACLQLDPVASERMASGVSDPATMTSSDTIDSISPAEIYAAVDHSSRRPDDRQQAERRKSEQVLKFFGIRPGMAVLDLNSGGGYHAELLSWIVGPGGSIVAYGNSPCPDVTREGFTRDEPASRYDAVIMIESYHDLYQVGEDASGSETECAGLLRDIFAALKSGGVLGIVDFAADPGVQPATGSALHRIDPAVIRRDMATAGFRFDGESDVLRNPDDDRSRPVSDPSLRGRPDRVVLRFRKP